MIQGSFCSELTGDGIFSEGLSKLSDKNQDHGYVINILALIN